MMKAAVAFIFVALVFYFLGFGDLARVFWLGFLLFSTVAVASDLLWGDQRKDVL